MTSCDCDKISHDYTYCKNQLQMASWVVVYREPQLSGPELLHTVSTVTTDMEIKSMTSS